MNHIALLVEDDPICGAKIEYWLRQRGWAVERVDTGTEGLRRYTELNPGLVIADAILSGMDGIGLCGRIRLQPFAEHVHIGLIAALPELRDAALAAGADFFLLKPIHETELAACLERLVLPPTDLPTERDLRNMTPVRVPTLQSEEGVWEEEGPLGMMRLVEMLKNLYERRFSGVLEVESLDGPGRQVKVFFERGYPAVARSSDKSTGFARILEVLGVASPDVLEASITEARRQGMPIGEVLLRNNLIDQTMIERTMREQIISRVAGIGEIPHGRFRIQAADPIGLAGFDVHPLIIEWRLGFTAHMPPHSQDLFAVLDPIPQTFWELIDPTGDLRPLIQLLRTGVTVRACESASPLAESLLALFLRYKLLRLDPTPPPSQRETGPRSQPVEEIEEQLAQRLRAASDATHYTVLGIRPDADTELIHAATVTLLATLQNKALPPNLSSEGRDRARLLSDRIREAGRVLADAARRAIYDARLAADPHLRRTLIGVEVSAELQADRAREHFRQGEFVTAAALFQHALRLGGEDAEILAMQGWARHCACPEDPKAGEDELRRSLALEADNEFTLYYLGRLVGARGQRDEARRLLRRALALNHEFEAVWKALKQLGDD